MRSFAEGQSQCDFARFPKYSANNLLPLTGEQPSDAVDKIDGNLRQLETLEYLPSHTQDSENGVENGAPVARSSRVIVEPPGYP